MNAEQKICPISGCENRSDPEYVIEFTIDGVEGNIKAVICRYCYKLVSIGAMSGLSLAPKYTPTRRINE